jgi:ubiquinone biosynthesis protein
MSTRPDLFPPHITDALSRLQDDVGAFGYAHVERALREDFGANPDELFARFERVPIASASVAQVHRASLADGTEVAVKVRRPRIEHIVDFDLSVMRLFARLIAIIPAARLLAPVESADEFARAIRTQIDLTVEAQNNRRFRKNFVDFKDVTFPALVPSLCSERVLTMTFLEGPKVLDYGQTAADPRRLAQIGFRILLKMVFDDGFVHADLHPGNILIVSKSKPKSGPRSGPLIDLDADRGAAYDVALLDLGLTAELDETNRVAFARYFAGWAQGDGVVMAKLMFELSPSAHVRDYATYEADVSAFVARYYGKALGEVQVSTVFFDMMGILRKHRVRVNPTFTMCNIAIAVTEGIGKQLAPELDLMSEALPFFAALQARGAMAQ